MQDAVVKEVQQTSRQIVKIQKEADTLTLTTPEDVISATYFLESIKEAEKAITLRKEEITRPLMQSLASVRNLFKPIELSLESAKKMLKAKMLAYQTVEDEKIATAKERIDARVEKGTLTVSTAMKKLEEVGTGTAMKTRTLTKVRVTDETLLPREYLTANMTKITEAILRQGVHVPGAESYKEKIVAS